MQPGETVGGRFVIERIAGSGGMGTVFRARDIQTGGPVAVKVLNSRGEQEIARFLREADVLFALHHARIVRYVAHGATRAAELYLVTEWLDGEDLEQRLARGVLTVAETITVGLGVAEALVAAHRRGVIHRDIKPSNIFLVEGKVDGVKILDFGIAHLAARAPTAHALTQTGMLLGTPGYMSPEQARGETQITAQSDVFSLGCVLFKCLTGQRAFAGVEMLAVLLKVVFEEPPRVHDLNADVPDPVDDLVGRMLSKVPSNRPADGEALIHALAAIELRQADSAPRTVRMRLHLTDSERRVMCVVLARSRDDLGLESTRILAAPGDSAEVAPQAPDSLRTAPTLVIDSRNSPQQSTLPLAPAPAIPPDTSGSSPACLVGQSYDPSGGADDALDSTRIDASSPAALVTPVEQWRAALEAAIAPYRAKLAILVDGSLLVTVADIGTFTDQASCAGRAALALHAALPRATVVLVAGRGEVHARLPVGEVIDRGVAMLRCEEPSAEGKETSATTTPRRATGGTIELRPAIPVVHPVLVRIDEVIAGLLAPSFEVGGDEDGLYLLRERDVEVTRTLLGRPTPCVGRERELATIQAIFAEVVSEPAARAVRVIGAAGIGKSRLQQELVSQLRAQNVALELWMSRGDPMRAGSPFGVLAPALRRAAGILEGEPLPLRRRKLRARAGRHLSGDTLARVTEFLGELIGTPFPEEESLLLKAAREDPILMGDQMRRAFEDLVAAECAAQPVLMVLEDLEWGDLVSLQFIDSVLRNLADRPILVLAVARPEIDQIFPNLWAGRSLTDIKLAGLTRRGSERLVHEVLGDSVDPGTVERIIALTGGNAFYLEELIRAVAEGKGTELPDTVLAMVQARLAELTVEKRRVLRAASVLGQVFWHGGVLTLLGGKYTLPYLRSMLDDLAERELIQRRPDTRFPHQQEFAFRHALVREAAYSMLTDTDRALGHRLAGAWLEGAGESNGAVLAEHFERGEQPVHAASAFRRAAEQALGGDDLSAALAWADRGIRCANSAGIANANAANLDALRLIKVEAHRWRGEFTLSESHAVEAIEGLTRGSRDWYIAAGEIAMLSGRLGHDDKLHAIGRELFDLWSDGAESAQIIATARAANILLLGGGYVLAEALLDRMKRLQLREKDPRATAHIHHALARRALVNGDLGIYIHHTIVAAGCCEQVGDLRRMCTIQGNLGYAQMEVGAYDLAERVLREALATAERLGLPNLVANTKQNLGLVLARRGALDEALRVETEALEMASSQDDHRLVGSARSYLATILHLRGALDEAERQAEAAVSTLSIAPPVRAHALATLASIRLAMGKTSEALRDATETRGILDMLGGIEVGEALIRLVHAEALGASGDHDAALKAITDAATRLRARADKLDGALREGFLTRIPENARTLALVRAWTPAPVI